MNWDLSLAIGGGESYRGEKPRDWLGKVLHDDAHQAEGAPQHRWKSAEEADRLVRGNADD